MTDATDTAAPPITPTLPSDAPPELVDAVFSRLRALATHCRTSAGKDDCASVLISACIDVGINRGKRITGTLHRLGFDKRSAGIRLNRGIGVRWDRDEDGTYRNLV